MSRADKKTPVYVFCPQKHGHYLNYSQLVTTLVGGEIELTSWNQVRLLLQKNAIVFVAGDKIHLIYSPFIVIRSLLRRKNVLLSIRSEFLLHQNLKSKMKRALFRFLTSLPKTYIVSIHKTSDQEALKPYITHFIYDIQYFDLKYLKIGRTPPPEIREMASLFSKPVLLILGIFNWQRCKDELILFLESGPKIEFAVLIAGKIEDEDYRRLKKCKNCFLINRYITDEEMTYLYEKSDLIYCYYDPEVKRPSGIFGRSIQLGKFVLVKKDGYLERAHKDYPGLTAISSLKELSGMEVNRSPVKGMILDDSELLKQIILG